MVPCALMGVARFSQSAMIRIRAFENYLRHFHSATGGQSPFLYKLQQEQDQPPSYVHPIPSPSDVATMTNPLPAGHESNLIVKPILEVK